MRDDQTFLPPHGNYRELLSFQKAEIVYDITFRFAHKFLSKGDRTVDQMIQSARSGKKNILEGSKAALTSKETEIKLTNVARASLEELLDDYRDYLQNRGHALMSDVGLALIVAFAGAIATLAQFPATAAEEVLKLEPVFAVKSDAGGEVLQRAPPGFTNGVVAFRAVASETWPSGLVPLFVVKTKDHIELRRLPTRGQENVSEPLFFALPPEDEPEATAMAGRWSCVATNSQGTKHYPDWELAVEGERLAGRFGQNGEYRVAFINGGTIGSNHCELNVDWGNDRYVLTGELREGRLAGVWRQQDDSDHGLWEATRPQPRPDLPTNSVVALHEWRNAAGQRRYSTMKELPGWQRSIKPVCRVWTS